MSYPVHVIAELGSLGLGLLSPPEASELNEEGCFSKEGCDGVEHALLKEAERRIKGFYLPAEVGHGSDPNNKWRTISSLQKAIRFGLVDHAQFAVSAAFDMDKSYTMKRLGVIAIEDCLMGNPLMAAITLAVMGHASWRKTIDERRLMIWLAGELAAGQKDRTAVNLLVAAGMEDTVPKAEWGKASNAQLIATARNRDFTYPQRMCAAWLLAGTKRYSGYDFPEDNDRRPTGLYRMMVEDGLNRLMLYLAAKTASRLSEAMFATMGLIHEMLLEHDQVYEEKSTIYPTMVGKLLGAAYDKHTREGKVAIKKFFRECDAMKPFMDALPPASRDYMQGTGVFLAEGGVLDHYFFYGSACATVTNKVRGPARFHLMGDLAANYLLAIRENLDQLNDARAKVLWAKQQGN